MPLLFLGLSFKSKRHYTSGVGSKPEVVISLSRIGKIHILSVWILQNDSLSIYIMTPAGQNLNHNTSNLKQHLAAPVFACCEHQLKHSHSASRLQNRFWMPSALLQAMPKIVYKQASILEITFADLEEPDPQKERTPDQHIINHEGQKNCLCLRAIQQIVSARQRMRHAAYHVYSCGFRLHMCSKIHSDSSA